jgi:hypothetical protein
VYFRITGELFHVETIASGAGVRVRRRLCKFYGRGRWRKRKGLAEVTFIDGVAALAELHWYEAAGIGKREIKLKRVISQERHHGQGS